MLTNFAIRTLAQVRKKWEPVFEPGLRKSLRKS
jgi:hypothetical protein